MKARRYDLSLETTTWTKINGSALRIYQEKEVVFNPGSQVIL